LHDVASQGSTGLLIASKQLFDLSGPPSFGGGGTVVYVSQTQTTYTDDIEAREEAGTPGIPQCIKTGLAFRVKGLVGAKRIEALEKVWTDRAIAELSAHPNIMLVGADRKAYASKAPRLSIISFNIKFEDATNNVSAEGFEDAGIFMLNPHYVIALLNDVYGIQARSGCSCTGPYGHRLFHVDPNGGFATAANELAANGSHVLKPGWARINLNYFMDEAEFTYIIEAIKQIASEGWKLLPQYRCDAVSGQFVHRDWNAHEHVLSLTDLEFAGGMMSYPKAACDPSIQRESYLEEAKRLYEDAVNEVDSHNDLMGAGSWLNGTLPDPRALERRWFPVALDAAVLLTTSEESNRLSKKVGSLARQLGYAHTPNALRTRRFTLSPPHTCDS